jgi:hypothetical protein
MHVKHLFRALLTGLLIGSSSEVWSADSPEGSRIVRWLNGKTLPHLDDDQAEAYAKQHQRRPEALLAAAQSSGKRAFLREAMAKYPHDKRVAMAAVFQSGSSEAKGGPQERRRWLEAFKSAAPDNALAFYLSAREHFKTGQPTLAEKDIQSAANKPIRDYAIELIDHASDAYLSAGYSEAEAISLGMGSLIMPHFSQLKDLGSELGKRAGHYRESGDTAASGRMLKAALRIGVELDATNSLTLLQNLVGLAIQSKAFEEMDPGASVGNSSRTVQAEMDRVAERRADVRALARFFDGLFRQMSDKEIGRHFNLQKRMGEEAADREALAARVRGLKF